MQSLWHSISSLVVEWQESQDALRNIAPYASCDLWFHDNRYDTCSLFFLGSRLGLWETKWLGRGGAGARAPAGPLGRWAAAKFKVAQQARGVGAACINIVHPPQNPQLLLLLREDHEMYIFTLS
jgi:hypothetical protein